MEFEKKFGALQGIILAQTIQVFTESEFQLPILRIAIVFLNFGLETKVQQVEV